MSTLAETIEAHLAESGSLSCDALAKALARRRRDVLVALREDPRFVQTGLGRWSRWQLAPTIDGDGYGTASTALEGPDAGLDTPEPAESFLARRCSDPAAHASWGAHWLDDDGATRCVRCEPTPQPPALTLEDYRGGKGSEEVREVFLAALLAQCSREQLERLRGVLA